MIDDNIMLAVPVGDSFRLNMQLNLYAGEKKEYGYIGLYKNKSIRGIGKVTKVVTVEDVNGELKIDGNLKNDEKYRLLEYKKSYEYIKHTELKKPDYVFGKKPRKVFFVDNFYETDYRNVGSTGIIGGKKIELNDIFSTIPATTKEIADGLKDKTFALNDDDNVDNIMLAVPVSATYEVNKELKLYSDGKKKEYGYIGLYKDKSICAIGKLIKVVKLGKNGDDWDYNIVVTKTENYVTEDEKNRISKMMNKYPGDYDKCKFFFVDDFYKTNYENEGTQGIVGGKQFKLYKLLAVTTKTKEIAYHLNGQSWQLVKGEDIIPEPKPLQVDKKNEPESEEKEVNLPKSDVANKSRGRLINF